METIFQIFLILALIAIYPLRLTVREKRMHKLAEDFGLQFRPGDRPNFFDFYFRIISGWKKGRKELNHIEGTLNNHKIHIYDRFHFFFDSIPSATIIEIDGEILGKTKFRIADYIFDYAIANFFYNLLPIETLRKVLGELQK